MTRLSRPLERLALLALAAFAFVVAIAAASPASAGKHPPDAGKHRGWEPVPTTVADWSGVAAALGREGIMMSDSTVYRVSFPRRDLTVTSYGVTIKPGFVDTPMTAHLKKNPLYAQPENVARAIYKAMQRGTDVLCALVLVGDHVHDQEHP